jgi:hypothetical protein
MLTRVASTSDKQTALGLQALRDSGAAPVTYAQLRALGVARPAAVIYELELAGHVISRGPDGIRLGAPDAEAKPLPPPPPRVRVRPRDDQGRPGESG